jgi:hypothetical protein
MPPMTVAAQNTETVYQLKGAAPRPWSTGWACESATGPVVWPYPGTLPAVIVAGAYTVVGASPWLRSPFPGRENAARFLLPPRCPIRLAQGRPMFSCNFPDKPTLPSGQGLH